MADNNTLSEELIRAHYKHKCSTGYDPLLCVHLEYWPLKDIKMIEGRPVPVFDQDDLKHYRHQYYHVDQVISEDRYVELIQKTKSSLNDLTDIDKVQVQNVWLPSQNANKEEAGIFWLKPTAKCRTLTDLYKQYEAKIKIMFGSW
jgi:hypothetical protein